MSGPAGHTKAALAALTGAAFIGLSPIAVRLSDVGPEATNFWRFVFAGESQYSEIADWAGYIGDQIARYEASQALWIGVWGVIGGAVVALLFGIGCVALVLKARSRADQRAAVWISAGWVLVTVITTLALTPVGWARYYIPVVLPVVMIAGVGAGWGLGQVKGQVKEQVKGKR